MSRYVYVTGVSKYYIYLCRYVIFSFVQAGFVFDKPVTAVLFTWSWAVRIWYDIIHPVYVEDNREKHILALLMSLEELIL